MVANVINEDSVEWLERTAEEKFAGRAARLGAEAGSENLGCSLYEVPPGRSIVPYHYHNANEEALYVLEGEGTLRTDSGEEDLAEGDYVAFPVGRAGAHQITNSSDDEALRYLVFSTKRDPEVIVYPDSGKFAVQGDAPGAPNKVLPGDAEAEHPSLAE